MAYQYEFDHTSVGNLRLARDKYEVLQRAYVSLRDELLGWHGRALAHGATSPPYAKEVSDLDRMIEWGSQKLSESQIGEIQVDGISVGSLRYFKAALMFMIRRGEEGREEKFRQGWPNGVLKTLDAELDRVRQIADVAAAYKPNEILWEVIPRERQLIGLRNASSADWDVFISHASEDKNEFVRPLRAIGLV